MSKNKCVPSTLKAHFTKCVTKKNMLNTDHRISLAEAHANCLLESLMKSNCWLELSPLTLVTD